LGIIPTKRIDIAYETSGSGEAGVVILIRGQGSQLIHWPESFYEAFSTRGFRTIRFDNRDTGLSGKIDHIAGQDLEALKRRIVAGEEIEPPYTLDDMALDVIALMDRLHIDSAHIAGISMGGFIAQLLAAKYPSRVLSMTSMSTSPSSTRCGRSEDPVKCIFRSGSIMFVSSAVKSISKAMTTRAGSRQPRLTVATRPTVPTVSCLPSSPEKKHGIGSEPFQCRP
jgi:pimeloyl-ACP methyl ester carboxylesterase